jgi:hypothetical protein
MRAMGHSYSFEEAEAEFSAMKAALSRNHNANLHKLPAQCVFKPSRSRYIPANQCFFFFFFFV